MCPFWKSVTTLFVSQDSLVSRPRGKHCHSHDIEDTMWQAGSVTEDSGHQSHNFPLIKVALQTSSPLSESGTRGEQVENCRLCLRDPPKYDKTRVSVHMGTSWTGESSQPSRTFMFNSPESNPVYKHTSGAHRGVLPPTTAHAVSCPVPCAGEPRDDHLPVSSRLTDTKVTFDPLCWSRGPICCARPASPHLPSAT